MAEKMIKDNDCGIVALANATGIPYDEVYRIGYEGLFLGNDDDSTIHMQNAINNLGFRFKMLTKDDICDCRFTPNRTVALMLANDEDPLSYHWFNLRAPNARGIPVLDGKRDTPVLINWNRIISGWKPLSVGVEVVGERYEFDSYGLPWYKRLWLFITLKLIKFELW